MLDVLIIGAGPTGINCAIAASQAHLQYKVIEKGVLANSIFNFPANMTFFSTSLNLEIGGIPFISHTDKPTRREALEYYRRLMEAYDIDISFRERVIGATSTPEGHTVKTDKGEYHCKNIVVATGFYDVPNKMNIPGENLPKVKHYYDEVHHYIQQDVLVVGAANSACDVALECWQKGARVTMAVRSPQLYERVKYWILPNIQNRIKEGSIKAHFNTTVTEIREQEVVLSTPNGPLTIANDYVLAMTGYSPDYSLLKSLGVAVDDDQYDTPLYNEKTLESKQPGIYLAGVVNGGRKTNRFFIENTRDHAEVIMRHVERRLSMV